MFLRKAVNTYFFLGQSSLPIVEGPSLTKDLQTEPKKRMVKVRMVRQRQRAWYIRINKPSFFVFLVQISNWMIGLTLLHQYLVEPSTYLHVVKHELYSLKMVALLSR